MGARQAASLLSIFSPAKSIVDLVHWYIGRLQETVGGSGIRVAVPNLVTGIKLTVLFNDPLSPGRGDAAGALSESFRRAPAGKRRPLVERSGRARRASLSPPADSRLRLHAATARCVGRDPFASRQHRRPAPQSLQVDPTSRRNDGAYHRTRRLVQADRDNSRGWCLVDWMNLAPAGVDQILTSECKQQSACGQEISIEHFEQ